MMSACCLRRHLSTNTCQGPQYLQAARCIALHPLYLVCPSTVTHGLRRSISCASLTATLFAFKSCVLVTISLLRLRPGLNAGDGHLLFHLPCAPKRAGSLEGWGYLCAHFCNPGPLIAASKSAAVLSGLLFLGGVWVLCWLFLVISIRTTHLSPALTPEISNFSPLFRKCCGLRPFLS